MQTGKTAQFVPQANTSHTGFLVVAEDIKFTQTRKNNTMDKKIFCFIGTVYFHHKKYILSN